MSDNVTTEGIASCVAVIVVALFLALIISVGGCLELNYTYSEGFRDGYVQKFSEKGIVFKSWEGELALPGIVRTGDKLTGTWAFSVDDVAVREELLSAQPEDYVRLHYIQILKNARFWHDTDYRVIKIEHLKKASQEHRRPGAP